MARKSPWSRDGQAEASEAKRKLGEEREAIENLQRESQKKGKGGANEKLREQATKQEDISRRITRLRAATSKHVKSMA